VERRFRGWASGEPGPDGTTCRRWIAYSELAGRAEFPAFHGTTLIHTITSWTSDAHSMAQPCPWSRLRGEHPLPGDSLAGEQPGPGEQPSGSYAGGIEAVLDWDWPTFSDPVCPTRALTLCYWSGQRGPQNPKGGRDGVHHGPPGLGILATSSWKPVCPNGQAGM